jgi:two-component system, NarL family, nitrate/nitrite response regulator NarL
VLLTVSESNHDVSAALNAGANGYVLKGVGSKALAEILKAVAAGETYVSPTLAARLLASLKELSAGDATNPVSQLTQREMQILQLVANGLTNKEVALRLDLQEKTVKHHMTHVLAKLNVRNRTEAAMLLREASASR